MVVPHQYFEPYRWQAMTVPRQLKDDLADIPKQGIPRSTSKANGIAKFPENQQRMWAAYYASVTFMDEQVGRVLDSLDRLGLRESTAIVFTSDHGYHLGEHDLWSKVSVHEESARVPLIISVPGKQPVVCDSLVELLDLYPTVSKLCGMKIPENLQGHDISPILDDPKVKVRDAVLCGALYREQRWALMNYGKSGELYDMEKDPKQYTNLFSKPEYAKLVEELKEKMKAKRDEISKNDLMK